MHSCRSLRPTQSEAWLLRGLRGAKRLAVAPDAAKTSRVGGGQASARTTQPASTRAGPNEHARPILVVLRRDEARERRKRRRHPEDLGLPCTRNKQSPTRQRHAPCSEKVTNEKPLCRATSRARAWSGRMRGSRARRPGVPATEKN